jgi:hypothetical protein
MSEQWKNIPGYEGRYAISEMILLRIVAPHFVAGAILHEDRVWRNAPILSYMRGWTMTAVTAYCVKKRWNCEAVL